MSSLVKHFALGSLVKAFNGGVYPEHPELFEPGDLLADKYLAPLSEIIEEDVVKDIQATEDKMWLDKVASTLEGLKKSAIEQQKAQQEFSEQLVKDGLAVKLVQSVAWVSWEEQPAVAYIGKSAIKKLLMPGDKK